VSKKRFADWDETTVEILETGDEVDEVEVMDPESVEAPPVRTGADEAVEYHEDYIAAFFDANNRPVRRELAHYAKVWDTVDGQSRLRIIALDGGAGA
jgi:hypothetical protein